LGEQLRSVEKQTGKTPELLKIPPLPEELEYLWEKYIDVKKGCELVNYESLSAYINVTKIPIAPFESDCLIRIDKKRIEVLQDGRNG